MNNEQQQIIETLERGNLVGRANGESRILGGTAIHVVATGDATATAVLSMPHDGFSIERTPPSTLWLGLVEMRKTWLCVYTSEDPVNTAQGIVNYFALARASNMALRDVRKLFHTLEQADIQLFAVSAIHLHLYWDNEYGRKAARILDTDSEKLCATIHLDLDTLRWMLKGADKKKRASGTLAEVVQAALKMRNLPQE